MAASRTIHIKSDYNCKTSDARDAHEGDLLRATYSKKLGR